MNRKVGLPTYQTAADHIESAIVAVGASESPYKDGDEFDFAGMSMAYDAMNEERKHHGEITFELSKILPPLSRQIYGPRDSSFSLLDTVEITKLGYFESKPYWIGADPSVPKGTLCRATISTIFKSGRVAKQRPIVFSLRGDRASPILTSSYRGTGRFKRRNNKDGTFDEYEIMETTIEPIPEIAAWFEWAKRTCWSVKFSLPQSPSVSIPTDPTGVKELLRMRDVPDGKSRREALKHWVKEHFRKNRNDPSVEHSVRAHLRGADCCNWFGLMCKIVPSKIDLARNQIKTINR